MSLLTTLIGDKRRWRAYRARIKNLPPAHRTAALGMERYLTYTGPTESEPIMQMLEDLADLFDGAAAAGTSVSELVGADPLDFAEEFKRNYATAGWHRKVEKKLLAAVAEAEDLERSEPSSPAAGKPTARPEAPAPAADPAADPEDPA